MVGIAGAGESTMLESIRRAWEAAGYAVKGAALAGIAAENLENASGIAARTLASWERSWESGRDLLSGRTAADRLRQRSDEVAERLAAERQQERAAAEALVRQQIKENQHRPILELEKTEQSELKQDRDQGFEL